MKKLIVIGLLIGSLGLAETECTKQICVPPHKRVVKKTATPVRKEKARIVIINNNTNVNNNVTEEKTKTFSQRVIVDRVCREESRKNSISLLLGRSVTGLQTSQPSPSTLDAKTVGQFDAGAMYQRDFGRIRISVGGTMNGSVYGGVGLNF
jgi:hypothetical protein